MKRYFIKPRSHPRLANIHEEPDAENYLARTVFEPDDSPIETGALDADGRMIVYTVRIGPIGFITSPEDE